MINLRTLGLTLLALLIASTAAAQDLAKYRDFRFGMALGDVTRQIKLNVSEARTTHQRPATIQTIQWDPGRYANLGETSDSLRSIRFEFYNGELFKMLVTYDPVGTEGLTTEDVIEAISMMFGAAARPEGTIAVSRSAGYYDNEQILARWESEDYSHNLFRSPYGNVFGLVSFSRKADRMAGDAVLESDRLDKVEAPIREQERQAKLEAEKRDAQAKARVISKSKFRP
jgi:hypothetical protein